MTTIFDLDVESGLYNIATGLRTSRLARNETCELASQRVGVGIATYKRMENSDTVGCVALQTVLAALAVYGRTRQVLELGATRSDEQLPDLLKITRVRASSKRAASNNAPSTP
jgi:hypothetical protein